jgi:hypothetical protein
VGQLAIFFQHLGRIAARPAVDPVDLLTSALLTIATAPTAAVVVIPVVIIQGNLSLNP